MAKKKEKKFITKFYIVLGVVILILLILGITFTKSYIEKTGLRSLQSDMKSLLLVFKKVDAGWEYDEHCVGYGSDVARNNSITCYIKIENNDIKGEIGSKYNEYSNLLFSSGDYLRLANKEATPSLARPDLQNYVTKSAYRKYDSAVCELRTQAFVESENRGILLNCSFKATKPYFERRD